MFITTKERVGTCYLEFQFCKSEKAIKRNKLDINIIKHWQEDSLLISDKNFHIFYKLYGKIFNCALLPNNEKGFDSYGINYYDKKSSENIIFELKDIIDKEYLNLIIWLKEAIKKYNSKLFLNNFDY